MGQRWCRRAVSRPRCTTQYGRERGSRSLFFWNRCSDDTLWLLVSLILGKAQRYQETNQAQGGDQGAEAQRAHDDGQAQGLRIRDVRLFITLLFIRAIDGGDGYGDSWP